MKQNALKLATKNNISLVQNDILLVKNDLLLIRNEIRESGLRLQREIAQSTNKIILWVIGLFGIFSIFLLSILAKGFHWL